MLLVAGVAAGAAEGCGSLGVKPVRAASGNEVVVVGDWNDVEAAALAAMDGNETTIIASEATDARQVFELLTIMDREGRLIAQREGEKADLIPIRLSCSIGPFGDPQREESILHSAGQRLRDLAGVDYRPRR